MILKIDEIDDQRYALLPERAGDFIPAETLWCQHGLVTVDSSHLAPGDVFLSVSQPDITLTANQGVQSVARKRMATWSHVAIYADDGLIWELMPDIGLRAQPMREFMRDKITVTVRRMKSAPQAQSSKLTSILRDFFATRYSVSLSAARKSSTKDRNRICSTFVSDVIEQWTGEYPINERLVLPQSFADSVEFQDVSISYSKWC